MRVPHAGARAKRYKTRDVILGIFALLNNDDESGGSDPNGS
jgi:hypothetical protein